MPARSFPAHLFLLCRLPLVMLVDITLPSAVVTIIKVRPPLVMVVVVVPAASVREYVTGSHVPPIIGGGMQ